MPSASDVAVLQQQVRRLTERVRELTDRQEILDCLTRYSRGLDRHDDAVLLSAFHPDAVDNHGDFVGSPADFATWAREIHETDWAAHTHLVSTNTVEIEGDVAHSEAYFYTMLRRKDGHLDFVGGRYVDRLERRSDRWGIAARQVVVEWAGNVAGVAFTGLTGTWDRTDKSYERPLNVQASASSGQ